MGRRFRRALPMQGAKLQEAPLAGPIRRLCSVPGPHDTDQRPSNLKMLRAVAREAAKRSRGLQLQQQRFLNVHEYQASCPGASNPLKAPLCRHPA